MRVPQGLDAAVVGRGGEELEGVPGDAVLGVVDVEVTDLDDELLAPGRVIGEEVPEGAIGQLDPVCRQVAPRRGLVDRQGHGRRLRAPPFGHLRRRAGPGDPVPEALRPGDPVGVRWPRCNSG